MSGPLRLGLIGCGRIAEHGHAPAIAARDDVVLAAVADPTPERRRLVATTAAATEYANAAELIAAGDVDAVIVAGPAKLHVEHAGLAADAGLPCLVEKPPAPDVAGARELAALTPAPWVGFNRRFHQGIELAAAVPESGPIELELELRYRRASWRPHEVRDDALLDLGPHLADLALLLGGHPARVHTAESSPERAAVELETARGRATIRCATDRAHLERVIVRRPGGGSIATSVSGGPVRSVAARFRRGPHPLVASLGRQLAAFAGVVRGDEPGLLASAGDGVRAMTVIAEAAAVAAGRAPQGASAERPKAALS